VNIRQRAVLAGLLVLWLAMFAHFWTLNCIYAAKDYHVTYPMLYIAVENWMLFCGAMATVILYKIIGDVEK